MNEETLVRTIFKTADITTDYSMRIFFTNETVKTR